MVIFSHRTDMTTQQWHLSHPKQTSHLVKDLLGKEILVWINVR